MKKKLAILVASPLTENIYERIGANHFDQLDVTVFDCLHWLTQNNPTPVFTRKTAHNIVEIRSLEDFKNAMKTTKPDYVLDFIWRNPLTKIFQKECKKNNTLYITHRLVPFPTLLSRSSLRQALLLHPLRTAQKSWGVFKRILTQSNPYPPDIALIAGAQTANPWLQSAKKTIDAATPDYYEIMALAADHPQNPEGKYILFIDDCLPMSFDYIVGGFQKIIDTHVYFSLINRFFSRLEKLFGLPVVIAGHPNGKEYPDYTNLFGGRRVEFGQTAALSFDCAFALTHYSGAINYPIMLKKRVNTVTFDALKKSLHGPSVEYIASLLARTAINLTGEPSDEQLKTLLLTPVNQNAYERYQQDYIVNTPTPGTNPFDNLQQYLLSLP